MAHLQFDLSPDLFNDDWFLSRRLLLENFKNSLTMLEKMGNIQMVEYDDLTSIDYRAYDVDGSIGFLISSDNLKNFQEFVNRSGDNGIIKQFLNLGSVFLTEDFIGEVNELKSTNKNIQETINILQNLTEKADTIMIINAIV